MKPPQWHQLQRELEGLALRAGVDNAYIRDAWGNRWCSARAFTGTSGAEVDAAVLAAIEACSPPLPRGGRLDVEVEIAGGWGLVLSFAGVYLLVVHYQVRDPMDAGRRHVSVRRAALGALPTIEALTLALPPPTGPGTGSAEGMGTA